MTFCAMQPAGAGTESPRVVATIKPIHSLVSGVMEGVGVPDLLLPDGASPHAYALRPTDARVLRRAELVIWVGPELESFIARPLRTLGRNAEVIELLESPDLRVLPVRGAGNHRHGGHRDNHAMTERTGGGPNAIRESRDRSSRERDPHIWLDPTNAETIARLVGDRLGKLDPNNAFRYLRNVEELTRHIVALDRETNAILSPVRLAPFFVFHDAFQYFERRYALRGAGSLTLSPERKPGGRRLAEVRRRIRSGEIRCVFSEPQVRPAIVAALTRGTGSRHRSLDTMGTGVPPGPTAYFVIVRTMARSIRDCLAPGLP